MTYEPPVRCSLCRDAGWLRQDVQQWDHGFGKLVRCSCNPERQPQEPAPEPHRPHRYLRPVPNDE